MVPMRVFVPIDGVSIAAKCGDPDHSAAVSGPT